MKDVAPELLEKLEIEFKNNCIKDVKLLQLQKVLKQRTGQMQYSHEYAERIGENLSRSFLEVLKEKNLPDGRLYYNIGQRTIVPMLKEAQISVNEYSEMLLASIDEQQNIGIGSMLPEFPEGRIDGLVDKATARGLEEDLIRWLGEPVINNCEAFADDFVKENAKFRAEIGMESTIERIAKYKCCEWCAAIAGKYKYGTEPKDIYRRHEFCRCIVTFHSQKGKNQNVWSKEKWQSTPEEITQRKNFVGEENFSAREKIQQAQRLARDQLISEYAKAAEITVNEARNEVRGLTDERIRKKILNLLGKRS